VIRVLRQSALMTLCLIASPSLTAAGSFDHLTELTGKVVPIVTLKARDNFISEYTYDISVRNQSPETMAGDSLVIVLDKITNLAGEDRQSLNNDTILSRFDVLGEDGVTDDGKPFFRIPAGNGPDLPPQTDSRPASVRVRNKDYMAVFTPSFRVYGLTRQPERAKPAEAAPGLRSPAPPTASATRQQVDKLIQLLIKKGVLTEEEWRKANQP
jgi:hypothetical protein